MKERVDVELWARFIDKVIEQTNAGILKWEMKITAEYARYSVCSIGDRTLWFSGNLGTVELVEADGGFRWTVHTAAERKHRLIAAIGSQLTPTHMAAVQQAAREYLGESQP